jgi:hypothetical protein
MIMRILVSNVNIDNVILFYAEVGAGLPWNMIINWIDGLDV